MRAIVDLLPPTALKKSDFHYDLPAELIAQAPLAERSASRLMLVPAAPAPFTDLQVRDLPSLLQPGDLLVFNDTRVIPARLFGQKASGGRVEILIERLLGGQQARAQVGASKSPKAGSRIALDQPASPAPHRQRRSMPARRMNPGRRHRRGRSRSR